MRKLLSILTLILCLVSCKTDKKTKDQTKKVTKKEVVKEKVKLPEAITKVIQKHGGLDAWKKAKTMSYNLKEEKHTIDLPTRKTLVSGENYSLGYDGKEVWLKQQDSTAFTRDHKFYYNLFFYFYAMPFVLADDGIIYEDVAPLVHDEISYPGVKISYKANVGTSPDDNYFIYYNSQTYQMEWLGYTVTYRSKKPSDKVKMIRYNNWENVDGFLLPKSITWCSKDKETGELKESKKAVEFSGALVLKEGMGNDFYENMNK